MLLPIPGHLRMYARTYVLRDETALGVWNLSIEDTSRPQSVHS